MQWKECDPIFALRDNLSRVLVTMRDAAERAIINAWRPGSHLPAAAAAFSIHAAILA